MKMIEKVAKALCEEEHDDKANWTKYVDRAKVAIGAMKEPSEAMRSAYASYGGEYFEYEAYKDMIDAALKDE